MIKESLFEKYGKDQPLCCGYQGGLEMKRISDFINLLSYAGLIAFAYICIALLIERAVQDGARRMASAAISKSVAPAADEVAMAGDAPAMAEIVLPAKKEQRPAEDSLGNAKRVYAKLIRADRPHLSAKTAEEWAASYLQAEIANGLPRGLALAIGHVESWHDPKAVSSAGAIGLMQIQLPTATDFAPKAGVWKKPVPPRLSKQASRYAKAKAEKAYQAERNRAAKELAQKLVHPASNIKVGAKVLASYIRREGALPQALKKYSGGAVGYHRKVSSYRKMILAELDS